MFICKILSLRICYWNKEWKFKALRIYSGEKPQTKQTLKIHPSTRKQTNPSYTSLLYLSRTPHTHWNLLRIYENIWRFSLTYSSKLQNIDSLLLALYLNLYHIFSTEVWLSWKSGLCTGIAQAIINATFELFINIFTYGTVALSSWLAFLFLWLIDKSEMLVHV